MSTQTRVVRLLQNTLYPTYQLHATMSNKQTTPCRGASFCGAYRYGVAASAHWIGYPPRAGSAGTRTI